MLHVLPKQMLRDMIKLYPAIGEQLKREREKEGLALRDAEGLLEGAIK